MTFTTSLKEEITKNDINSMEARYELMAFLNCIAKFNKDEISITLENASIARRIYKEIKEIYDVSPSIVIRMQKRFKVKQIYISEDKFNIGVTTIKVDGIKIKIYDKEKLLIELVKNSKNIPFDYYKEIINNYRSISDKLDMNKLSDYLNYYKNDIDLFLKIQKEVF